MSFQSRFVVGSWSWTIFILVVQHFGSFSKTISHLDWGSLHGLKFGKIVCIFLSSLMGFSNNKFNFCNMGFSSSFQNMIYSCLQAFIIKIKHNAHHFKQRIDFFTMVIKWLQNFAKSFLSPKIVDFPKALDVVFSNFEMQGFQFRSSDVVSKCALQLPQMHKIFI